MSKFNCCYRYLQRSDASHAWIELHRLVEAYSRTTGEPFTNVFEELEKKFNFDRAISRKWPTPEKMLQAGTYLKVSRDAFLDKFNQLVAQRKIEKKTGKREIVNPELLSICHKQNDNSKPEVGYWGWEKMRKLRNGDNTDEFISQCITDRYAFIQEYLLEQGDLNPQQLQELIIHGKNKEIRTGAQNRLDR